MANKLPKHILQMVEKNNLVMAIKTLADEQNISMEEAKDQIDSYEMALKQKQINKVNSIASKQDKKKPVDNHLDESKRQLNAGLDTHLNQIGYKKPLIPYWVKRVMIFLVIVVILGLLIWQLMP